MEAGLQFLKTYRNPQLDILNQVSSQRLQQVSENRERLRPIIESIIFLGRQNIPLRGHRDDGALLKESENPFVNEGNFRELLRLSVPIKLLHSSQSSSFTASSTLRCTSSTDRTSTSSQHLRSAGICCCWTAHRPSDSH